MRSLAAFFLLLSLAATASGLPEVVVSETPFGGIQPVARVDSTGTLHLVYFKGEEGNGNLFHTQRPKGFREFSKPVRVNTRGDAAIAIGTIRGAHLALGRKGHIHVAWMGSRAVTPDGDHHKTPMLYARSTDGGKTFERERNVITKAYGLDGGGTVSAGSDGRVRVWWHAGEPDKGEESRKVWMAVSSDDGRTFATEVPAWEKPTGVCPCCGMSAADVDGRSLVLFRSATKGVNRDMYLLKSLGDAFNGVKLDSWRLEGCPMSSMAFSVTGDRVAVAWEAVGKSIAFKVGDEEAVRLRKGEKARKFPTVALAPDGHVLLAWIEGGGWKKGGNLGWQLFNPTGKPMGDPKIGLRSRVWSKPAAIFDGSQFLVFH